MWRAIRRFITHQLFSVLTGGGLFWDAEAALITNVAHFYTLLLFIFVPVTLTLVFPLYDYGPDSFRASTASSRQIAFIIYVIFIAVAFLVMKILNLFFHFVFDSAESLEEEKEQNANDDKPEPHEPISGDTEPVSDTGAGIGDANSAPVNHDDPNDTDNHDNQANYDQDEVDSHEPEQHVSDDADEENHSNDGEEEPVGGQGEEQEGEENEEKEEENKEEEGEKEEGEKEEGEKEEEEEEGEKEEEEKEEEEKEEEEEEEKEDEEKEEEEKEEEEKEEEDLQAAIDLSLGLSVTFNGTGNELEDDELDDSTSSLGSSLARMDDIQLESQESQGRVTESGIMYSYIDEDGNLQYYLMPVNEQEESHDVADSVADEARRAFEMMALGRVTETAVEPPVRHAPRLFDVKLPLLGSLKLRLSFDRPSLESWFDRDRDIFDAITSVVLAVLVGVAGFSLSHRYAEGMFGLLWCSVAASQYSLLKTPQPDSASAIPGYNRSASHARASLFLSLSLVIVIFDAIVNVVPVESFTMFYGIKFYWHWISLWILEIATFILPLLPVVAIMGWTVQPNTLLSHLLEHVNVRLFGGTAAFALKGAFWDMGKSVMTCLIVFGTLYGNTDTSSVTYGLWLAFSVMLSVIVSQSGSEDGVFFSLLAKNSVRQAVDRMVHCVLIGIAGFIIVLILHATTLFSLADSTVIHVFAFILAVYGWLLHYIHPQLRRPNPFGIFAKQLLPSPDDGLTSFPLGSRPSPRSYRLGVLLLWANRMEKVILMLTAVFGICHSTPVLMERFGDVAGSIIVTITSVFALRSVLQDRSKLYLCFGLISLMYPFDLGYTESFLIDYWVASAVVAILVELVDKIDFVFVYVAPWNVAVSSATHVVLYPLALPHSAFMFVQALISTLISAPLYPLSGAALFLVSYVRPVRFWEKKYKTTHVDDTTARLDSALGDAGSASSAANLNSVFYEHITTSLQASLASDIESNRFSEARVGDFFLFVERQLTFLMQIVQRGDGWCTFQLRGMEFKGTYCQERELEAVNEDPGEIDEGITERLSNYCYYSRLGRCIRATPPLLSLRQMLVHRWQAWQVMQSDYLLEGYDVTLNPASSLFEPYGFRIILLRYYVMALIYYLSLSDFVDDMLNDSGLNEQLHHFGYPTFVDKDGIFTREVDADFDVLMRGVSMRSFFNVYGPWIAKCAGMRANGQTGKKPIESLKSVLSAFEGGRVEAYSNPFVRLCLATSLLARRALARGDDDFLRMASFFEKYYAAFKGDTRVTDPRDEWVFQYVDLLTSVLKPSTRMSLKLHVDHFADPDMYEDLDVLYDTIVSYTDTVIICSESEPQWRDSIMRGVPHLLSLRIQVESSSESREHWLLQLELKKLPFRVIRINPEMVRGFWSSAQHELVFLGNQNPERGSIQNMQAVLRNLIVQCCDLPVGYPVFVSALSASFCPHVPIMKALKNICK